MATSSWPMYCIWRRITVNVLYLAGEFLASDDAPQRLLGGWLAALVHLGRVDAPQTDPKVLGCEAQPLDLGTQFIDFALVLAAVVTVFYP